MNPDETAEQCASRELFEETSLRVEDWQQIGAFSDVGRDPRERVVTIAFYVGDLLKISGKLRGFLCHLCGISPPALSISKFERSGCRFLLSGGLEPDDSSLLYVGCCRR